MPEDLMSSRLSFSIAASIALFLLSALGSSGQAASPVDRGSAIYAHTCAPCHQPNLGGSGPAPSLAGTDFIARWKDLSGADLLKRISTTMPPGTQHPLTPEEYRAVTAYLLDRNQIKTGEGQPDDEHSLAGTIIH